MNGLIEAVCVSTKKGVVKKEVQAGILQENFGLSGDAHAGDWHRQISILAGESIEQVKKALPGLRPGAFAENLITRGLDLTALKLGDRLSINDQAILEVTQIGKECHNHGCAIKKATGDCIMPREGVFARVLQGGPVRAGDRVSPLTSGSSGTP